MMVFEIQTIPHKRQRYPTVGDYWETAGVTHFRISRMDDEKYEWLVLIHEMVEYALVKLHGVPLGNIDIFDKQFEKARPPGNTEEPGDHPDAPYRREHQAATVVERVFAFILGVDWDEYEKYLNTL